MSTEEGEVREGMVSEMDFIRKIFHETTEGLTSGPGDSQSKQGRGQDFMPLLGLSSKYKKLRQRETDSGEFIFRANSCHEDLETCHMRSMSS